jgi:hypothetical protein
MSIKVRAASASLQGHRNPIALASRIANGDPARVGIVLAWERE